MVINQGDVYWADIGTPTGSGPGYTRPVTVISNNALNYSNINTVLVCPLSTNLRRSALIDNVLLYEGEGGIAKASVVLVSQTFPLDKRMLRDYLGTLSRKRVRAILDALRFITEPRDYEEKPRV